MFSPKTNYAKIAYEALLFYISTGQIKKHDENKISADLKLNRACIVTIYDTDDKKKGSYGSIEPLTKTLYDEIIHNIIHLCKANDVNITQEDLNQIKVYVDVISVPHKVDDFNELKPHKHGLFVKDKNNKSGYILPNIKGIKTVDHQIEWLKKEKGIEGETKELDIKYFKTTRYD